MKDLRAPVSAVGEEAAARTRARAPSPCGAETCVPGKHPAEKLGAMGTVRCGRARYRGDLRLGGFTPMTTVDYPGQLAAVVFCQGCPWRCRYCHNGHLVPARRDQGIAWNQVKALLDRRRGLLDAVVFSGGEPTLQASLRSAMEGIKAMGFRIGLHTAGPYPERLRPLLPSLDWVGLDIKALPEDYADVTRVPGSGERAWESLGLLIEAGVELEVRTTLVPGWDTVAHIRDLIVALSHAGVENYVVQECRTATMLDPSIASANVTGDLPAEIREMGAARFLRFAVRQARP